MKRYTKEFITDLLRDPMPGWKAARLKKILKACERGLVSDLECVKAACSIMESGPRWMYEDLNQEAKENCKEQFMDIMCPYDSEGIEDYSEDDWRLNINEWIGEQYWIDLAGNWYDEERKVRV